jgi:hypothetical protein
MDVPVGRPVISQAINSLAMDVGTTSVLPLLDFFVGLGRVCSVEEEMGIPVAGSLTSGVGPGWGAADGVPTGVQAVSRRIKPSENAKCLCICILLRREFSQ